MLSRFVSQLAPSKLILPMHDTITCVLLQYRVVSCKNARSAKLNNLMIIHVWGSEESIDPGVLENGNEMHTLIKIHPIVKSIRARKHSIQEHDLIDKIQGKREVQRLCCEGILATGRIEDRL